MHRRRKILLNSAIVLFFILCVSQWVVTPREDWPWSYFGMYKKRVLPKNVYSFKLLAQTKDGQWVDAYLLAPFDYYGFTDKIEEIVRDRKVSNVNTELQASEELLLDEARMVRLQALLQKNLEPHFKKNQLEEKIKSLSLKVRYWHQFRWKTRKTPDVDKILLRAELKNGEWHYSR